MSNGQLGCADWLAGCLANGLAVGWLAELRWLTIYRHTIYTGRLQTCIHAYGDLFWPSQCHWDNPSGIWKSVFVLDRIQWNKHIYVYL